MSVSICCESINNSVSLFHTQFVLDLFFSSKQFQWGVIYPWDNFPGGSFPRGHWSEVQSCWRQIIEKTIFLGDNFQGDCRRAIIWGQLAGLGNFPRRELSWAINQGGNYLEGNFPRGQLSEHHLLYLLSNILCPKIWEIRLIILN